MAHSDSELNRNVNVMKFAVKFGNMGHLPGSVPTEPIDLPGRSYLFNRKKFMFYQKCFDLFFGMNRDIFWKEETFFGKSRHFSERVEAYFGNNRYHILENIIK